MKSRPNIQTLKSSIHKMSKIAYVIVSGTRPPRSSHSARTHFSQDTVVQGRSSGEFALDRGSYWLYFCCCSSKPVRNNTAANLPSLHLQGFCQSVMLNDIKIMSFGVDQAAFRIPHSAGLPDIVYGKPSRTFALYHSTPIPEGTVICQPLAPLIARHLSPKAFLPSNESLSSNLPV